MGRNKRSRNVVVSNLNFGGASKRKRQPVDIGAIKGDDIARVLQEAQTRRLRGLKL